MAIMAGMKLSSGKVRFQDVDDGNNWQMIKASKFNGLASPSLNYDTCGRFCVVFACAMIRKSSSP